MSMNTYPLSYEVALVITPKFNLLMQLQADYNAAKETGASDRLSPEDIAAIATNGVIKAIENRQISPEYIRERECDFGYLIDYIRDANKDANMVFCSDFDGEASSVDQSIDNPLTEQYSDDFLLLFEPEKSLSIFSPEHYNGLTELLDEFRTELQDFLPEELDIRPYLMTISGTYFC